jgi:PTH1 family peptidyl-tRNA hydrolase
LNSIIYYLQTEEFSRIRIGVGNQFESGNLPDYVLSDFNDDEFTCIKKVFDQSTALVEDFICGGYQQLLYSYSIKINQEKLNKKKNKTG